MDCRSDLRPIKRKPNRHVPSSATISPLRNPPGEKTAGKTEPAGWCPGIELGLLYTSSAALRFTAQVDTAEQC
jgi:hypothetical protein